MIHLAAAVLLTLAQNNDKAQANGYDDAWKSGWRSHCMSVLSGGTGKVDGFVIHVGDSITYSSAYGAWIKGGAGKTTEDTAITNNWCNNFSVPSGIDATSHNGLYLANVDIPGGSKSMSAAGGIATDEYLSGSNNGNMPAMPSTTVTSTGQGYVSSTSYPGNLQIDSVAAAFSAAQVAVLMLGTNDCTAGRTASAFIADLGTIVTKLEFQHIAVVLSTIPPHTNNSLAQQYNAQITSYAQTHGLPLIDFYAEVLARQPVNYASTLMVSGDVHPSGDRAGYTVSSDPYANGGNPTTHKTGAAAAEVGYLLRTWLTAQKLKEVQSFVVQGNAAVLANPTSPAPPGPTPGPTPAPTPSAPKTGGGGGGHCGGSIAGPVSPFTLLGTALAALVLLRLSRKTGF